MPHSRSRFRGWCRLWQWLRIPFRLGDNPEVLVDHGHHLRLAHGRGQEVALGDAPAIRTALQDTGIALHDCATLPEAVHWAAQRAHAGDAVLLSPACASLDMFRDYAHRAQVFVDTVQALAQDAGQDLGGGV